MARTRLEERVAALEREVGALLANHTGTKRSKDWRRTRGVFTGDDFMKQVFEEGRKIRQAERKEHQRCSGWFLLSNPFRVDAGAFRTSQGALGDFGLRHWAH